MIVEKMDSRQENDIQTVFDKVNRYIIFVTDGKQQIRFFTDHGDFTEPLEKDVKYFVMNDQGKTIEKIN